MICCGCPCEQTYCPCCGRRLQPYWPPYYWPHWYHARPRPVVPCGPSPMVGVHDAVHRARQALR